MERRDKEASLPREYRMAVVLREHLDLRACVLDPRRADEDPAHRIYLTGELEVGLERVDLSPPRVALDLEVDEPEMVAVEDDHPGARAEDGTGELPNGVIE